MDGARLERHKIWQTATWDIIQTDDFRGANLGELTPSKKMGYG